MGYLTHRSQLYTRYERERERARGGGRGREGERERERDRGGERGVGEGGNIYYT